MQVVATIILSTCRDAAAKERWEGKEEHFLLSRARAACYSIAVLQLSAFTRGPTRFFFHARTRLS